MKKQIKDKLQINISQDEASLTKQKRPGTKESKKNNSHNSERKKCESKSNKTYQTISESFVYDIKKELLDKMDKILRKVNIEIIKIMETNKIKQFNLISMQQLQEQIKFLFDKLDQMQMSKINNSCNNDQIKDLLLKENQQLVGHINQLQTFIEQNLHLQNCSSNKKTNSNVDNLKNQVNLLNQKIQRYQKTWQNTSINNSPKTNDIPKKVKINISKLLKQLNKLKNLCKILKKQVQDQNNFMLQFKKQVWESWQMILQHYNCSENDAAILKQELQYWQNDVSSCIKEKLEKLIILNQDIL